jgi:WS/DGAT/MGAT family acyltransferase
VELTISALVGRATQAAGLARLPLEIARKPADALLATTRALRAARSSLTAARPAALNAPNSSRRHLARASCRLDDLRTIKSEHGATVNDVVLAAVAGALGEFLEARGERVEPLKAMVPVSVRDPGAESDLGNRISFVFVELPCDERDPLARLDRVKRSMSAAKLGGEPQGAETLLAALEFMPRTIQQVMAHAVASPRMFNVVVSNIPGPPLPLYMNGCRLREAYPVVPLADSHGVAIGMTTVDGQACFGIYADAESVPEADELAAAIETGIGRLQGAALAGAR